MNKTYILSIAIFFFFPISLIAQKKKKEVSSISISSGLLLYHTKFYKDYSVPFTIEYQYTHRKNNFGGGIQLDFLGGDKFIGNDVYEFLPKCVSMFRFTSAPLHCPYSFTYDYLHINLFTSYQYNFIRTNKVSVGIKSSILFFFNYYTHYTDKYPKINTVTGVLLDPGPFETDYTEKKLTFQNIGLAVAPIFYYHLKRNVSPFVSLHLQQGFDNTAPIRLADTRLFALLGLKIRI